MNVAILGASPKPDRYSYRAQKMLMDLGYEVIPISPTGREVLGVPGFSEVPTGVDTVTVYLSPKNLLPMLGELVASAPRRVIFNPGTESEQAANALRGRGIEVEEACTLVLLSTGDFA